LPRILNLESAAATPDKQYNRNQQMTEDQDILPKVPDSAILEAGLKGFANSTEFIISILCGLLCKSFVISF